MSNVKSKLHQPIIKNFISVSNKPLPREASLPFSNIRYTDNIWHTIPSHLQISNHNKTHENEVNYEWM